MPIPSPVPEKNPYQSEATQEIFAFVVALLGIAAQIAGTVVDKSGRSEQQKLAMALYGADRDSKLIAFAREPHPLGALQIVGWVLTAGGLALLFWFKFKRAQLKDAAESQMKSPEGLRGCAQVLYALLKNALKITNEDGQCRVTIYRVTAEEAGKEPELQQAIDYVGAKQPKGMGRKFPMHIGVIGLAARTGEAKVAVRKATSDDEYRTELVNDWGYTKQMASDMMLDRKAFIAVPIKGSEDEVIGIVYADSNVENAFDDDVAEQFVAASAGFAAYIKERFPHK